MTADTCPTCGGRARKTYASILIGGVNRGFNNSQPVKEERHVGYESLDADQIAVLVEAAIQPRPNGHKWCALCGMWAQKDQEIDHSRTCVLADLPAAARERAEEREMIGKSPIAQRTMTAEEEGKWLTEMVRLPPKPEGCGWCGHSVSVHVGFNRQREPGKNGGRYPCGTCPCPRYIAREA